MQIKIFKDYKELSKQTANEVVSFVQQKPDAVIGLLTGSTPLGMYEELVRAYEEKKVDFSQVRTFNLDEYFGLGIDLHKTAREDQSYARYMWEHLFKHINVREGNWHIPNGLSPDPEIACQEYENIIHNLGGIDLQVMGIGGDGHFGFNEPGSSFASRTRLIDLTDQTLEDNFKSFFEPAGYSFDNMPKQALTMGIATVLEAKRIIQIIRGENRAEIVYRMLTEPINEMLPSTVLKTIPHKFELYLDEAAASKSLSLGIITRPVAVPVTAT
ncbi:MAG TPA: glucosamine-6-phosphate deaminase [bacterium]|nr:glucosamine-6-phosphate deaminase [bacterium]